MSARVVLGLAAATALAACTGSGPVVPAPSRPRPSASAAPDEPIKQGVFHSRRFGVNLKLPGGSRWKVDDTRGHWLVAADKVQGETLLVRLWNDENRMNRDKCEARARSFRTLPDREGLEIVESQRADLPRGFDTQVDVGLTTDEKGGVFGTILGFGGSARRCFAYVYVTRAEGPGADAAVADRLALMMQGSMLTLEFESDLDVVLERQSAPLAP